jgi:SAM-dependent methyltransferase
VRHLPICSSFKDHFSGVASSYAAFRPRYPAALFDFLASTTANRRVALDCATGNGQAARGLADRFDRVLATDASVEQLRSASRHASIVYAVARAESLPVGDGVADLVTVAQALHWFDRPRFFAEARRVLAPGGILAAWTYGLVSVDRAIDPELQKFHGETVGPWWPPERKLVDDGYRTIDFPFEEVAVPKLTHEADWTLAELAGYLGTWSATQRFRAERGEDPVPALVDAINPVWGEPSRPRRVCWPLFVRAGRARKGSDPEPGV